MTKLEKYAAEYARLIAESNDNKAAIKSLLEDAQDAEPVNFPDKAIDLSCFREFYYSDESPCSNINWNGWVFAICNWNDSGEGEDGCSNYSPDSNEYELAELLDKKTANTARLGIVKRSICAIGRGLLNNV